MNKTQLSDLLDKYLNGTCTPEETEAIDQWYKQYNDQPGHAQFLSNDSKEALKVKMFDAIREQAYAEETAVVRPIYRKWWVKVAAAAILTLFVKFFFFDKDVKLPVQPETASLDTSILNRTQNIVKQILPDGSIVWLNPNAGLSWHKQFQVKSRDVSMTGNCFFEVAKNPNRPFIINSEHIVTKVWGTSFRVIDGKDVSAAKVTVVTGKVSVSKKAATDAKTDARLVANEVMLYPKQQVVLINNAKLVATKQTDMSDLTLYKHLDLSFDNAKLTEIASVLNKKFDVNIKIRNEELEKAVMTADLTDLNLPEVLEVLKASMKLDYEISNDLIVFKKTN